MTNVFNINQIFLSYSLVDNVKTDHLAIVFFVDVVAVLECEKN